MLVWGSQRNRSRSKSNQSKQRTQKSTQKPLSQKAKTTYHDSKLTAKNHNNSNLSQQTNFKPIDYSDFQKYNISQQKLNQLYKIFQKYDKNSDGMLSLSEFERFMKQGGQQLNYSTAHEMHKQIKSINKRGIQFIDLVDIVCLSSSQTQLQKYEKIFKKIDKNKRGWFNFDDYCLVAKTMGQEFSKQQLKQAFEQMDRNKDGLVTLQQFAEAMIFKVQQK